MPYKNKISLERIVLASLFIFVFCNCVWTQDIVVKAEVKEESSSENKTASNEKKLPKEKSVIAERGLADDKNIKKIPVETIEIQSEITDLEVQIAKESLDKKFEFDETLEFVEKDFSEELKKSYLKEKLFFEPNAETPAEYDSTEKAKESEKFHWKPAIIQSLIFLGIQNAVRTGQEKTRREFGGEFFRDWGVSVRNLSGWKDGDSSFTNYFAHPLQGLATGRIFINNSDKSKKLDFGKSKEYWKSRFKAMAWSAVWSVQFELGPFSEASYGNVGLYDRTGPNRMAWVDIVVTPTLGTGALIVEDMIDKYVIKNWLEKGVNPDWTRVKLIRTFLTPIQSFVNIISGRVPWHRDNRRRN